ncbi:hypothetical protein KCP77_07230 [Salmonella enterica subsp. enterica]|nr:hypothetical protein KCP77_07230 [Salmonella enterica subsp. enterica]
MKSQKRWGFRVSKEFQTARERLGRRRISMKPASKRRIPPSVYDAAVKLTRAQNKLQSLDPADPGYAQAEAAVEQAGKEATGRKGSVDKAGARRLKQADIKRKPRSG